MADLARKRVLVTGASSGIGAAIARELASAGAVVGLCARRTELLEAVLADCRASSPESRAWTVDLGDLDGIDRFAAQVEEDLGPLDVLVNNAGVVATTRLPQVRWDDIPRLMHINYLSPIRLTLAVLPGMLARGAGQVLTVSSVAARLSPPVESAYAATKAAITAWFESAAADLWDSGVTFHLLYPGFIRVGEDVDETHAKLHTGMDGLPPEPVAEATRRQLEDGTFEVYIPESFGPLYARRAQDVGAFVATSAAFARQQLRD